MPLVPFRDLMARADAGKYAVGYFESWNLESLLAVADAAEAKRSPVILGFSGIYLPHPDRRVRDPLASYAAMATAVCRALTVPACLLFNESPHEDWVAAALSCGFNLVMFSDETQSRSESVRVIRRLADAAHREGAAIEGEMAALAGVAGDLADGDTAHALTDPAEARAFVAETAIDALAVAVGQVHLHGRSIVRLDLERLCALAEIGVPLVLHGASSVAPEDLRGAIAFGVRKINIGSRLKQAYFTALRDACARTDATNPYEVIGSGLAADVLVAGRLAMQAEVERFMDLFGSSGKVDIEQPA